MRCEGSRRFIWIAKYRPAGPPPTQTIRIGDIAPRYRPWGRSPSGQYLISQLICRKQGQAWSTAHVPSSAPDAWPQPIETWGVFGQRRWRPDADPGAGALAGGMARRGGGGPDGRPRGAGI